MCVFFFLEEGVNMIIYVSQKLEWKLMWEQRLRSSEANESLRKASLQIKRKSPPSADQALVGALIAAAFGLLLYKFTTSVENTLSQQVLSNNYSVITMHVYLIN